MRRKKSELKELVSLLIKPAILLVFLIAVFLAAKPQIEKLLSGFFSFSLPETPAVPREFASTASQGSFTELFSGTGWLNKEKTDVYQDQKLSSISFPPDYEWQEVSALSDGLKDETIIAANGNGKEVVLIAKNGKIFEFKDDTGQIRQVGQTASVQVKNAVLDYDDSAGVWVVAASSGNGIEAGTASRIVSLNISGSVDDLACANGECLLLADSNIYRFAENNPSSAVILPFPKGVPVGGGIYSVSLGKAKNILLVGGVEKKGSAYSSSIFKYSSGSLQSLIINDQSLFSSVYPGTIRFGYDSENNQILAVYAAYIGQAKLFQSSIINHQPSTDFSRFFSQRVMDGNITPKILKYGNAWWLSSKISQPAKFIRVEGGAGVDFADTLIRGQQSFELLPGFNPNELYAIVGSQSPKIYRFIDKGYKKDKKIVWESLRLNRFDNEIISGKFYEIHGGEEDGKIRYYLSNDGGKNWQETKLNETVNFTGKGNDFRFKVELYPDISKSKTPWLNLISVEYYSKP